MKKVFLMILMAGAMIALTTGCDKKKSGGGGEPIKKMLPSEIVKDDGIFVKISYNNKNRIIKEGWHREGVLYAEVNYAYDGTGRLTSIKVESVSESSIIKSINGITGDVFYFAYSGNSVIVSYDEEGNYATRYELQGDKVIKIYGIVQGKETIEGTYTYDSKGNVIKILYEDGNEALVTCADKNGIYSGINMPIWFLMGNWIISGALEYHAVNNPLLINEKGEIHNTYSISYDYESYNNDYPEKLTITKTDGYNQVKSIKHFEIKYIEAK